MAEITRREALAGTGIALGAATLGIAQAPAAGKVVKSGRLK